MKKTQLILIICFLVNNVYSQDLTIVNVTTSGTLNTLISSMQETSTTNIKITGSIDGRDIFFLRDKMTNLSFIDLSLVNIVAYNGDVFSDYKSNELPNNSFSNKTKLKKIILPKALTSIGNMAFEYCSELENIEFPNGLTSIGNYAFLYCSKMTGDLFFPETLSTIGQWAFTCCFGIIGNISIPKSLQEIGGSAFLGCGGEFTVDSNNTQYTSVGGVLFTKNMEVIIKCPLKKINSYSIPTTVKMIGPQAFAYCKLLTDISIPNTVLHIWEEAFYLCSGLTSIKIPSSVSYIGSEAFYLCKSIQGDVIIPNSVISFTPSTFSGCGGSFVVDSNHTKFSTKDGVLFNKDQTEIYQCPVSKAGSYEIPNYVTTISVSAFHRCENLTSITIPSSVSSIIGDSFSYCTGLVSLISNRVNPLKIDDPSIFYEVNKSLCTLYVPAGSKNSYENAMPWSAFSNIVEQTTSTTFAKQDKLVVTIDKNSVIINGGKLGELAQVFSLSGLKTDEQTIKNHQTAFTLRNGVYILKIGNYSEKIVVR